MNRKIQNPQRQIHTLPRQLKILRSYIFVHMRKHAKNERRSPIYCITNNHHFTSHHHHQHLPCFYIWGLWVVVNAKSLYAHAQRDLRTYHRLHMRYVCLSHWLSAICGWKLIVWERKSKKYVNGNIISSLTDFYSAARNLRIQPTNDSTGETCNIQWIDMHYKRDK